MQLCPQCAMATFAALAISACNLVEETRQPELEVRSKAIISSDGWQFRDLNNNAALDPYEDWRLTDEERTSDLVSRMDLSEKIGTLLHGTLWGQGGPFAQNVGYDLDAARDLIAERRLTTFISRIGLPPAQFTEQNNQIQALAEDTRLGIPATISTDPRNHFQSVLGASNATQGNTVWPELSGFAALNDLELVEQFGAIARAEYRAVGLHMALSPQLDLITEPRWTRASGSFGSNAGQVSALGAAYVRGFQGGADGLDPDGVLTVVKHWVGYSAQPGGYDAHSHYGRFARPAEGFSQHIAAFRGALEAKAGGVMPAYPILVDTRVKGEDLEPVAAGYNAQLLQTLLREENGFDGLILSDWGITADCNERCYAPTEQAPQRPQDVATPWGVEELSVAERYAKGLNAGLDQIGGTEDVTPFFEAIEAGLISEERLNDAVTRVLMPKFRLGLFENPYMSPADAEAVVGNPENHALAQRTQAEAQVLLQNNNNALPFDRGRKVWLFGVSQDAAEAAGLTVVASPTKADFAIIRASTPFERLHPNYFFGSFQNEGRLDFREGDAAYDALLSVSQRTPTVFSIFMDRPAILTNVVDHADVVLANFGASDEALLQVLLGEAEAKGRLPYSLPRSMSAVEAQDPGLPDDSVNPLFERGFGL